MDAALIDPGSDAIALTGCAPGQASLLTPAALALLADLHRRFEPRRQARLAARQLRQLGFDAGGAPDFRADTAWIRAGAWGVAEIPEALRDRRVEITGPPEPRKVVHALNSGAQVYMADFEDSTTPTWANLLMGQQALRDAITGTLQPGSEGGTALVLKPRPGQAVLMVRPRGWHLDETHVRVDGAALGASLFDAGLFAFHNAASLAADARGPYFYLPKLESMEEAALWDDALEAIELALGLPPAQIKVTALIETVPAAFEMDEILHALRRRITGLNCGRWDYIFSYIKTFRAHRDKILPERAQLTMAQPFLTAYSELLVRTCHRRGAHAMGGMAAQVPIRNDPAANARALERVRADKRREVSAGHDGTWVAHPALVPVARAIFDERSDARRPPQRAPIREDQIRDALVQPATGSISRAGFEDNVEVCVRYLAAWLDGQGCVPIHALMEDAATAEIARAQLWQWLHADSLALDDGAPLDFALFEGALQALPGRLAAQAPLPGMSRFAQAIALLDTLTRQPVLADFLTLAAAALVD